MKYINLQRLIDENKLDADLLAAQLFPKNKHPRPALNRVLKGEAFLDSAQIANLSVYLSVPIDSLFSGAWNIETKGGVHTFKRTGYTAVLNTETWVTKIFKDKSLLTEVVVINGATPLSLYFTELDNIFKKLKR